MAYTFELRPLRNPAVLRQLTHALEERESLLRSPHKPVKRVGRGAELSPEDRLRLRRRRYRVYQAAFILMGVSLLLPALTDLKNMPGQFLGGLLLILFGIAWLWLLRTPRQKIDRASREELSQQLGRANRNGATVLFAENGMTLRSPAGRRELVPYRAIEFAFEADDLLVLIGTKRAVALQKLELSWGDWPDFQAFLIPRVNRLIDLRT